MSKLNAKIETFVTVEYTALDYFINEVYGLREGSRYASWFECVLDKEWSNNESHTVSFKKKELDSWDSKKLEQFKVWITGGIAKRPRGVLYIVMQDLVNREILPEAKYLIQVWW